MEEVANKGNRASRRLVRVAGRKQLRARVAHQAGGNVKIVVIAAGRLAPCVFPKVRIGHDKHLPRCVTLRCFDRLG